MQHLLSSCSMLILAHFLVRRDYLRKNMLDHTVLLQRRQEDDEFCGGTLYPAYVAVTLTGEEVFFFSGDYEAAKLAAEDDGYTVLGHTIMPMGATRH